MTGNHIQLVVLDIGGVMIGLANGWRAACECAGVRYRPFARTPEFEAELKRLEAAYGTGRMSADDYFAGLRRLLGERYPPEELRAAHQAIIREELPGISDLVAALKGLGLRTACLSNSCATHWEDLASPARYPGIAALDCRHVSHLLGVMKPDARIYRLLEEATGFSGGRILFFDDVLANVQAARERGWRAVQVTNGPPAVEQIRTALAAHGIPLQPGLE